MTQPNANELRAMHSRFAPTLLRADLSGLSTGDRKALDHCVKAARIVNELYFRQVYSGNPGLRKQLANPNTELEHAQHDYFHLRKGPWCPLDLTPFIAGVPEKQPEGANLYPEDLTKEEFEAWIGTLSAEEQAAARGFFTVIRRGKGRKLKVVPYSQEYAGLLRKAARHLRRASVAADDLTLRAFTASRADALLSNSYSDSDVAWLGLNGAVEIAFGPYETYEDTLFGYKALFEAYVTVVNATESANLQLYAVHLQGLENNLPIDERFRCPNLAGSSPMKVVDLVYASGEAMSGIMTAAFNLPNDEAVRETHGTKQVLLKNVQRAKFDLVLTPIARRILPDRLQHYTSFEAFFTHILWHELFHGLGPHNITVNGNATTVRLSLTTDHSAFEEAKADICGLWGMRRMIDEGVLPGALLKPMYVTYLASAFRSMRFGIEEAHGKGQALQFNYLVEKGAFKIGGGMVDLDFDLLQQAVSDLCGEIMTIQANGNAAAARAMLEKYGTITPAMQEVLDRLSDVPVDIAPTFEHYQ